MLEQHHINSFLALEEEQQSSVVDEVSQSNLKIFLREYSQLKELSVVLQPFLEATQAMQSEREVTISLVVPLLVGILFPPAQSAASLPGADGGFWSLEAHFGGNYGDCWFDAHTTGAGDKPLKLNKYLFFMAAVPDPKFHFRWLCQISYPEEDTSQ